MALVKAIYKTEDVEKVMVSDYVVKCFSNNNNKYRYKIEVKKMV